MLFCIPLTINNLLYVVQLIAATSSGLQMLFCFQCRVFIKMSFCNMIICRVAVVGNVDAGKSTLLGVLTHGELDNGRGVARQKLFRHKHEMESGRTSSVGNDILGFDDTGVVVNKPEHGHLDWIKICEEAAKVSLFVYTNRGRNEYYKI